MKLVIDLVWEAVEKEGGSNPLGNTNNYPARDCHAAAETFSLLGTEAHRRMSSLETSSLETSLEHDTRRGGASDNVEEKEMAMICKYNFQRENIKVSTVVKML